jgi:hypothetical protein
MESDHQDMSSPIVLLPRAWLDLVDSELLPDKSATSAVDSVSPILDKPQTLVESAATEHQLTYRPHCPSM